MKLLPLTASLLVMSNPLLAEDCSTPASPTLPKGAESTMEQMLEGQKAVKAFQAANIEYMCCREEEFMAAEARSKGGDDEKARAAAHSEYNEAIAAYTEAVSEEETVAGQFTTEIRAYKEANSQ